MTACLLYLHACILTTVGLWLGLNTMKMKSNCKILAKRDTTRLLPPQVTNNSKIVAKGRVQEQRLMKDNLRRSVQFFIAFSRLTIISTINSGSIHYSAVPVPLSANYVALNKCCLSFVYHDNLQSNCKCHSFFYRWSDKDLLGARSNVFVVRSRSH